MNNRGVQLVNKDFGFLEPLNSDQDFRWRYVREIALWLHCEGDGSAFIRRISKIGTRFEVSVLSDRHSAAVLVECRLNVNLGGVGCFLWWHPCERRTAYLQFSLILRQVSGYWLKEFQSTIWEGLLVIQLPME